MQDINMFIKSTRLPS